MSFEHINKTYGLKARVGGHVCYSGGEEPKEGTITGVRGQYVRILLDGDKKPKNFHPTWELEYND